ncbi:MAG: hypothetical protein FGF48_10950 [Candidatus Brockarchaeota archaeon]|nr:hypothetical protein [Candidatus Brockarchaeota archaeon]
MPYKIKVWIPVEEDEPEIYKSRKDALRDLETLKLIQPENIYRIVKIRAEESGGKGRKENSR